MPKLYEENRKMLTSLFRDEHLSHAILLEGESGLGKKNFARALAQKLLCPNNSCMDCNICRKIENDIHPDVTILNFSLIDEIRQLRTNVYIKPNESDIRIVILCDVQNLTTQAQNAFLKTLEEPPKNVMLILTCDNRRKLLPTILSRTMILQFKPNNDCENILLSEVKDKTEEEIKKASMLCRGNIGKAKEYLYNPKFNILVQKAEETIKSAIEGDEYRTLICTSSVEKDSFSLYLRLLTEIFIHPDLQTIKIKDVTDYILDLHVQNVSFSLLTASLAAGLCRAVSK